MSELQCNLEISLSKEASQDTNESVSSKNTNDSLLSTEEQNDEFNEHHFEEICKKLTLLDYTSTRKWNMQYTKSEMQISLLT